MRALDPDVMYAWEHDRTLAHIEFKASRVEVLEIATSGKRPPTVKRETLEPEELITWLETDGDAQMQRCPPDVQGRLRLILGFCDQQLGTIGRQHRTKSDFPLKEKAMPWYLPFSQRCYEMICSTFQLPRATAAMISRHEGAYAGSHFHVYSATAKVEENERPAKVELGRIGITMKTPGFDLVGMDASFSLSHCVAENITDALLVCSSSSQINYIADMVERLATLATHPAAIPVMLCRLHQDVLLRKVTRSWGSVFDVEAASGLSGITLVYTRGGIRPSGDCDDPDLSRKAIRATQLAIAWETYTLGSQAVIAAVDCFLNSYVTEQAIAGKELQAEQSSVLKQYLGFVSQSAESLYHRAKHLRARAEVQVGAINNHLAHTSNQINQRLASSSQRIAVDAQRDTSAMKSIAVLTMTFLPATFIATLFATPGVASTNPSQGLYWGITVAITVIVLGISAVWTVVSTRKGDRAFAVVPNIFADRNEKKTV